MKTLFAKRPGRTVAVFGVLAAAILMGCTWPGPHLQHNTAVDYQFNSYQIYPQHQYYIAGTLKDPRAILALKPGYTLESPGWQAVNMTPELLERWIAAFNEDSFVEGNVFPDGANIIGHNGELAGYYYSAWEYPVVRIPRQMTIALAVPEVEYRPHNEKIIDFLSGGNEDGDRSHR